MVHLMTFTHYNRSLKPTHEKRSSKSMNGILNIIEYWNIFYGIYFNWLAKIFQATYSIISYDNEIIPYFISLGKVFTFTICFSIHYRIIRIRFSRIYTDWEIRGCAKVSDAKWHAPLAPQGTNLSLLLPHTWRISFAINK